MRLGVVNILNFKFSRDGDVWLRFWSKCLVEILKMKYDQDLCLNLWYDPTGHFGNLNSTLRSVAPMAMFSLIPLLFQPTFTKLQDTCWSSWLRRWQCDVDQGILITLQKLSSTSHHQSWISSNNSQWPYIQCLSFFVQYLTQGHHRTSQLGRSVILTVQFLLLPWRFLGPRWRWQVYVGLYHKTWFMKCKKNIYWGPSKIKGIYNDRKHLKPQQG